MLSGVSIRTDADGLDIGQDGTGRAICEKIVCFGNRFCLVDSVIFTVLEVHMNDSLGVDPDIGDLRFDSFDRFSHCVVFRFNMVFVFKIKTYRPDFYRIL